MSNPKFPALSLAAALALAGCGAAPEKPKVVRDDGAAGQAPVVESKTPEIKVDVDANAAVMPMAESAPSPIVTPRAVAKPAPKRQLTLPTDPNTFLVTADAKTQSHPFYGRGQSVGFNVNGVEGDEIVVTRGKDYKFVVDTGVQHDFYLATSAKGWGGGTYTEGVEGQFIYQGEVLFKPSQVTPDLLYYQCRNHKYMGGKILVINKGDDIAKLKASLVGVDDAVDGQRGRAVVSENGVNQKLGYAKMVMVSGSAKRIEASNNAEAIGLLSDARQQIELAKVSLSAGQLESAMAQVNEGLRLMTSASRAVTTETDMSGVDQKAKFEELSESIGNYERSYRKNIERATKSGQKIEKRLDEVSFSQLISDGKALAGSGDYTAASKKLTKAQSMITSILTSMLHAQTVTYDKNFESPKEEYEYELARAVNYKELIPIGIEQKKPSETAVELINKFVAKADGIMAEGQELAAKGDYKMGIMAMQAATSNLQRALRMAGVN